MGRRAALRGVRVRKVCELDGQEGLSRGDRPGYDTATAVIPVTDSGAEHPSPLTPSTPPLPSETVKVLLEQGIPNVPGKTFTLGVLDFPPSARAVPHRRGDAFVYAGVLEGSVRRWLDNEPVRTYRAGEHWVEPPNSLRARRNRQSCRPSLCRTQMSQPKLMNRNRRSELDKRHLRGPGPILHRPGTGTKQVGNVLVGLLRFQPQVLTRGRGLMVVTICSTSVTA